MEVIASAIVVVGLHEMAHIAMASSLGVRVHQVGLSWKGPFIRRAPGTDAQNLAITLAGPVINLLLALVFSRIYPGFALNNLVLGIINSLPFPSSDGSRALRLIRAIRNRPAALPCSAHTMSAPAGSECPSKAA
jgi:Zn-dependent protease